MDYPIINFKIEWQRVKKSISDHKIISYIFGIIYTGLIPIIISVIILNLEVIKAVHLWIKIFIIILSFIIFAIILFIFIFLFISLKITFLRVKKYEGLYLSYIKELNTKNITSVPYLYLPINEHFKILFKKKEKEVREIKYRVAYINSEENWNIKVGLQYKNCDVFYIIVHTRLPGNDKFFALPGEDPKNILYIAIENKDIGDLEQQLNFLKNFPINSFSDFNLKIENNNNKDEYKKIKYFINGNEIIFKERLELVKENCLHCISFEVWSTFRKPEKNVNIKTLINDFEIIWGN